MSGVSIQPLERMRQSSPPGVFKKGAEGNADSSFRVCSHTLSQTTLTPCGEPAILATSVSQMRTSKLRGEKTVAQSCTASEGQSKDLILCPLRFEDPSAAPVLGL